MRFRPDATGPEEPPKPGELPGHVDERQMSLFGAAWTAGSLKCLAEGGVESCTYFETTGWGGVMEREAGSPLPKKFPSTGGSVFPLYHVLADIGQFAGGEVIPTASSNPLEVDGIAVQKGNSTRLLACNMTNSTKRVSVRNLKSRVAVRFLDESNADRAMSDPEDFGTLGSSIRTAGGGTLDIELLPYAVCRIDDPVVPCREPPQ
jgi:hypothetical protein